MSLVLEIEHLLGVAFAARSQASSVPDWPPQPDRVFSALVAAWGARGERPDERQALEWLERQDPPEIAATGGSPRTAATVFVPPNDPQTGRVGDRTVMPTLRRRQPRRFPAYRPDEPTVRLVWRTAEADGGTVAALNELAADTAYVGHSASLTRCRFSTEGAPERTAPPRRRIYHGRLAELERIYRANQRPNPGETVRTAPVAAAASRPRSVFADRWLVLEHVKGDSPNPRRDMPDLRAAALIAKALRDTIMSGYRQIGLGARIPAIVSGHTADGAPLTEPHLAIAPLAFLGWPYADGRILGFALVPTGAGDLLDNPDFQNAMKAVAPWREEKGEGEAFRELSCVGRGFDLVFALSGERTRASPDPASLNPARYVETARTWATCTPIVLDRHLKKDGAQRDAEIAGLLRQACANIGLPPPARISIGKHSSIEGAPSACPSGAAPSWTGWRVPQSLASRMLTHARLQFDGPIRGPVILGAGRFVGLGLCLALDPER